MAADQIWTTEEPVPASEPGSMPARPSFDRMCLDPDLPATEVVDRICDDQRRGWRRGESPSAEYYLTLHPTLRDELEARLEIVFGEISLREERGEAPTVEEYLARFPELCESLVPLFRVHRAITNEGKSETEIESEIEVDRTRAFESDAWEESPLCPEVPARVGGYEIVDVLGRGGMGVVYRAIQPGTGRLVALKTIVTGLNAPPNAERRFRVEIEAIARLAHPNVVPIFDAGVHEGYPYLVMEYVPGTSLAERVAGGPIRAREAAGLGETLARAVHAMHARGVIHRDLKSANILMTPEGVPKIADFGLARLLDGGATATATGELLGTPQYMAPEQAGGSQHPVGPATDIYSLGAILYEQVTGRPPFQAPTLLEVVRQVSTTDPIPPSRLTPGLCRDFETIVLTCLRKEPARRYPDAAALADDLRRFLDHQPIRARPVGPVELARAWAARNPGVATLVAITAALLVVVVTGSGASARYFSRQSHDLALALDETRKARAAEFSAHQDRVRLSAAVEEERDRYRRRLYLAEMNLASQAWSVPTGAGRVAELLKHWDTPAAPNDPRGWEWDYLFGAVHEARAVLEGLSQAVWSPDGTRLAGRYQDALEVRDRDGRRLLRIASEGGTLSSPCWSPDGTRLAAITHGGTATIWDARTGARLWSVAAHPGRGFCLAWSPIDDRIATAGGAPAGFKIWKPPALEPECVVPMSETTGIERPGMLSWSPDATRLALADPRGSLIVHDTASGAVILTIPTDGRQGISVAYSPDGALLATLNEGKNVVVRDARDGRALVTLEGHHDRVESLAWSRDGRRIATGGWDHAVIVWELEGGRPTSVHRGHAGPVFHVAWGPGINSLISSNQYDETRFWETTEKGRDLTLLGHQGFVSALAWHPDGQRLASAGWDGTVRIWDTSTGRARHVLASRSGLVRSVAWHPDGRHLAVGGGNARDDRGVEVWDAMDGRRVRRFYSDDWANALAWSEDGARLIASWGVIGSWDAVTGKQLFTFSVDPNVPFAAVSPDGTRVVLVGSDILQVHRASDGQLLWRTPHAARSHHMHLVACWSPDARRLSVVGSDGASFVIRVIDAATSQVLATLRGHTGPIHSLSWSPDGARLASAGRGGEVKIWNHEYGVETLTLPGHVDEVWAVAWSPDGTRLATAGVDRTVRIRDASRGQSQRSPRADRSGRLP